MHINPLLHAAPTGAPTAVSVVSVNLTTIKISWAPINCIQENSIIKNYIVYYRKRSELQNSKKSVSVSANVINATIHELNPNTEYVLDVEAVNVNYLSSPSAKLSVNTSVPKGTRVLTNYLV